MPKGKFLSDERFKQLLEDAVMPTFDLVITHGDNGVLIVRRKIAPYQHKWALPGLRQLKGERFRETLARIAKQEAGLIINPEKARILEQYDGFFKTESGRQDISTGYCIQVGGDQKIVINPNHFSGQRFIQSYDQAPKSMGAMYKFFLKQYFGSS